MKQLGSAVAHRVQLANPQTPTAPTSHQRSFELILLKDVSQYWERIEAGGGGSLVNGRYSV